METIIEAFKKKNSLLSRNGAAEKEVKKAEQLLKLKFASDYRAYLLKYAVVAYSGHEFTGITKTPRLDVVSVTQTEKEANLKIPRDMYVVERTGFDGIIIWQRENGEIYYSQAGQAPMKYCNSLMEYVEM